MHKRSSLALSCACAVAITHAAHAAMPDTYKFMVRITQQDSEGECPAVGMLMPLSITVDRAFPVTPPRDHTEHYHGGPGFNTASPILSVSVNHHAPYEPNQDDAYVTKDDKGVYGYDFLGFDFSIGIAIDFSTTSSAAVPTYRLPPSIFPHRFSTATFTYTGKVSACTGNIVAR